MLEHPVRFCVNPDGARIAYTAFGAGPAVVFPARWFNHLDVMWECDSACRFFESLAKRHTVVLYDKQWCGLSDRWRSDFSLDSEVRTLIAILDELTLDRVALFGFSQGGPPAVACAVTHPDRVSALVLFATSARSRPSGDGQAPRTRLGR